MLLLQRPSATQIENFLSTQRKSDFSYKEFGATNGQLPKGYIIDHTRSRVGTGVRAFEQARHAMNSWRMFSMPWMTLIADTTPIEAGRTVGILAHHFGFYSLNAARIVYTIDEAGPVNRYGFAYGTLREHAERGEERFSIEWREDDDSVWYDLLAFSRPRHPLARLGYPLTRHMQKKFASDSHCAMQLVVGTSARSASVT